MLGESRVFKGGSPEDLILELENLHSIRNAKREERGKEKEAVSEEENKECFQIL